MFQTARRNYLETCMLQMWEADHRPLARLDKIWTKCLTTQLAFVAATGGVWGGKDSTAHIVMYYLHCLLKNY